MAGAGDDYLHGVLGREAQPTGMGSRDVPSEIRQVIRSERVKGRERFESHRVGGAGDFLDPMIRTAGSMGGGYRFDEDVIGGKIHEFEDLRDRIIDKWTDLLGAAACVTPPSDDPPAVAQAKATWESIRKAAEHNRAMWEYAVTYISALRKANGTYEAQEEDASNGFPGGDGGGEVPPGTGTLFR